MFIFSEQLYGIFGEKNYVSIHLIIELFCIVVTMSIAIQIWLTSRFNLNNKDIYMGALFLSLAIFEIAHAISYKGMPFFIKESSPYEATWFYIIARLLMPIGLLSIVIQKDKKLTHSQRWLAFSLSFLFTYAVIILFYLPIRIFPSLVIEGSGTTLLKNTLQYTALVVQLVLIIYLTKYFNTKPRRSLLLMVSSIYIIFSDIFFTIYHDVYDIYIFTGHLFQLFSYITIFRAVYFSTVEQPFIRMREANSHLKKSRKEMHHMAYYDELTTLPNERFLMETLKSKFMTGLKQKTVIVFEFERLSAIKSSLGTLYSEQILKKAALRLQEVISSDWVIAKLRIDQFVIFIDEDKSDKGILEFCERLQTKMLFPFHIQHFSLISHINIGIAHYPKDGNSNNKLIKHAQFAMYEAGNVPERMLFYKSSMLNVRTRRVELENDLYNALEKNELFLKYQPQLNIQTGEIESMEALVRWKHPIKGWISPEDFIPIAEESGLIIPFGNWVLETACRQSMELKNVLNKPVKVAVNLSAVQLFQNNFIQIIQDIIEKTNIPPNLLELEITESMTMNTAFITPILNELKAIGITVAIDDFGTGYSSLSYLKDLPIDCLKIDRSFVQNIKKHNDQEPLVDMIISMARYLKLKVIAEGIETDEQLNYLQAQECEMVQGYLISKPIDFNELMENYREIQMRAMKKFKLVDTV